MELVVAEKPKVAQKIASSIGDRIERKKYKQVYYYEGTRDGREIAVAPAVGHVYSLAEKEKTNTYPVFDIEWKPAFEVGKGAEYTKQYIQLLEKLGKKADSFVSACDYDIEGSLIAYNVYRFAANVKEAHRMKFSALTSSDLTEAYMDMSDLDYNNAYAGEARHILDWYYGINLSRALMSALKSVQKFKIMSIGRVQGPALGIVSTLEKQIRAFNPEPFWEVFATIEGVEFSHTGNRFKEEKKAKEALKKTGKTGTVKKVEKKEVTIYPIPNFDLTTLQTEAYRLFKFVPSRTLEIAQSLYESSLISYPRTSSQQLTPKLNLSSIIRKISENEEYSELAKKLLDEKRFKPSQGKKQDPAHPAIHPTGQKGKMNEQEKKLYDLIVRRFLGSFAAPAKKERTRIDVDSNGETYAANGIVTKEKGWTEYYGPYYKAEEKELPEMKENEDVKIAKKKNKKGETKPPHRYTQASIVSALEKKHLGTKATRSVIVDTLFKRGYVEGKAIQVTDFGMKVSDILRKYAPEIMDENLTRKIEEDMEKIQEGKTDKEDVVKEGKEILVQLLDKWKKNEKNIGNDLYDALKTTEEKQTIVGKCDKCGKDLRIIRMKAGRQFIGCTGYPECRNAYPLPGGAFIATMEKTCEQCGKPMVKVGMKGKRMFIMCIDPNCPSKAKWKKKGEKK